MPSHDSANSRALAVIGAGHVGLVTAAGFSHHGHRVRVGEADPGRLAVLATGTAPFAESGLAQLIAAGVASGLLTFHSDNGEAASGATAIFIAVPTPADSDGSADLSAVEAAVRSIASEVAPGSAVVIKSSVPPGSWRAIGAWMEDAGCPGSLVINPEFLQEGNAVAGVLEPARVVVGSLDPAAADLVARLHEPMGAPVVRTTPASAELIKYAANAYLAMRVTFANSMANLAEEVGADIADVLRGVGLDPRIGTRFFSPGPGYGGSCFPKDLPALIMTAREHGLDLDLIEAVVKVNSRQPQRILAKLRHGLGTIRGRRVALWGLAFKAGTDDVSESPAVALARGVLDEGATVAAYDPAVTAAVDGVSMAGSALAAVEGADALVVATEWPEFAGVDLKTVAEVMAGRLVVDARNLLDKEAAEAAGLDYRGMGR
jgi:UDPglucose 6-dehydrogenase